ncbi:RND transporter [Novosphingobium sp. PC22D]|uniref:efflux transporter outer membrane subunit n=1 Tax=Novosphingobium sp. PC22D TaxID=1962403 RepID=UPI000BEFB56E|nr:efflux transporter outer membrane subunit [Novosphingobium sp. PC22D]PEQ13774.1 RND transporter [Novosphingobium sp. PC22D]
MRSLGTALAVLAAGSLAGCNLAPSFRQPAAPIASAYPADADRAGAASAAKLGWRDFFRDPRLLELIGTALERNRDLAQSYARIAQARAQYRVQAADRLPTISASASGTRARQPLSALGAQGAAVPEGEGAPSGVTFNQFSANVGVSSFELDLWGRVRNLSEAQRQTWLASIEGARAFRLSLIAQVAATYFDIRAGEERLRLARRTLEARREGVRIAGLRLDAGVTSTVDYDQTMLLLTQAETELAEIQRTTEQARNLLEVLVGGPIDASLPEPLRFEQQLVPVDPGLPSQLLENRPDILQAEHNLRAANANIGAARAAFFPQISLTGLFGFASSSLGDLFTGDNRAWSFGGDAGLPIFDWGRREGQLDLSRAQAEELAAAYQRAVQGAFREVADALVAKRRFAEQIEAQQRALEAQRRLAHTARLRYDNGIAIYLEVLDAERNLFSASQTLIQLRATELQNAVSLYVALGGGTQSGDDADVPGA